MKITGNATLAAPPQQVWDAFHDPVVLATCLPGCNSLTETGPHAYAMQVTAGVAAIKGTYEGTVALANQRPVESFTLKAAGAGAPGTVEADVLVSLAPSDDGGTLLTYDADASVGGAVGGVGQRMLSGVTRKMAGQFFSAVDAHLASGGLAPALEAGPVVVTPAAPGAAPVAGAPVAPRTYAGRAAAPATSRVRDFALGTLTGGAIALAGVLVGWAIGRG